MKIELNTLLMSRQTLRILGNAKGLSSVVAYRISKNIKAINKEVAFYEESRIKLLEEHSHKDDEGKAIIFDNTYDIIDGHMEIVNKELDELRKEEVELDIKKINVEDIDKAELSPFELGTLEFMFDFKEEEN
ncbi:MAG: hypothetical protein ACLUVC_02075 [Longibaculum sp.]